MTQTSIRLLVIWLLALEMVPQNSGASKMLEVAYNLNGFAGAGPALMMRGEF
jgi:hypothetical protein